LTTSVVGGMESVSSVKCSRDMENPGNNVF
jgi:hypothetical protein